MYINSVSLSLFRLFSFFLLKHVKKTSLEEEEGEEEGRGRKVIVQHD